jgi:hypothetical protein
MSDAFEKFAPEESAEDYLEREGTPKPNGEVEEGPGGFSEDALATLFTQKHGDNFRYVARWGQWLEWNDTAWQVDETIKVFDLARKVCCEAAETCNLAGEAKTIRKATTRAAVENLARSDRRHALGVDAWDQRDLNINHGADHDDH